MARLATAALVAIALLAPGCTGATDETSPATVDEISAAFERRGITLGEFVAPATKNSLVTVLAPRDGEQFTVSVLRTTEQARQLFQVATGQEPQFEVVKGSDVVLTERNVYVVFDTTGSDYDLETVRDALRDLS